MLYSTFASYTTTRVILLFYQSECINTTCQFRMRDHTPGELCLDAEKCYLFYKRAGETGGSEAKSTGCSFRRPGFNSQYLHGGSNCSLALSRYKLELCIHIYSYTVSCSFFTYYRHIHIVIIHFHCYRVFISYSLVREVWDFLQTLLLVNALTE